MPRSKAGGFTLIEVLVALAILSAVIGSILLLVTQHGRNAAALEDRALARIVAENAMVDYKANQLRSQQVALEGEEILSERMFTWEIDREGSSLEGFRFVEISVRLGDEGQVLATLGAMEPGEVAR